ncbi:MAG: hypothetical protein ABR84_05905 [Cryomorphaceae bacterium BACL21 MAG-121220-bin10]|jgi:hypothetical protein|nr:MAG: hypothetical protein ABR84_05905 [Cryomorphaceae bacterium BACL21 MAG-121220-bin10]MDA0701133.1 hypothetical protein [Bacteroidota bacterium]|tara:strand:+ start:22708 stop:23682 length:975 start_codon:yes stop_codon:yes gene_type:complete
MEKHSEEVDLFFVLKKLKNAYLGWLARLYRSAQFLKKHWIALAVIVIGGFFVGQFWQQSLRPKREAVIIVQNNFGSSSYVYNAVEVLNTKCKQIDEDFLKRFGFNAENPEIQDITIEPVVSVMDLLKISEPNDRNIDTYISKIEIEEDLMVSEIFYPQYRFHKITLRSNSKDPKVIDKIMAYLNANTTFNTIQEVVVTQTQLRVERNNQTIADIDALFQEYSGKNDREALKHSEIIMKIENNNLHQLVEKKTELIKENEELLTELTKYNSVVTVINSPKLYMAADFLDKKKTLVPVALLLIFFGYFWMKRLYLKGKEFAERVAE